jgi:hypothetical protein
MVVLGGGTNVVVSDSGLDALVVAVQPRGLSIVEDRDTLSVTAGAGEPWDGVVEAAVARGAAGLECLSGIPGLTGGTPIQNVGAYGQDVSGAIEQVTAFDTLAGAMTGLPQRTAGSRTVPAGSRGPMPGASSSAKSGSTFGRGRPRPAMRRDHRARAAGDREPVGGRRPRDGDRDPEAQGDGRR